MATIKPTLYIGGSLGLVGMIVLLVLSGVKIQVSGDMSCGYNCTSYFNMTLNLKNICWNMTSLIETNPEVHTEIFYKNRTKWKLLNISSTCFSASTTKKQFKVVGYKRPLQTVKWYSNQTGIPDPVWNAISLTVIDKTCINKTESQIASSKITSVLQLNGSKQDVTTYTYKNVNVTYCNPIKPTISIDNKNVNLPYGVSQKGNEIIVDDNWDGNADGICTAGESCCIITDKVECKDVNKDRIRNDLQRVGIE